MIIEQPSKWLRWLYPSAIWRMDKTEKAVYLTFDDGPIPEATPWILDTLDRYGVKATFFMVGDNVRKNPDLLEEVRRRGHTVGNHTYNHIGFRTPTVKYVKNVRKADDLIHSKLYRPPHGWMRRWPYLVLRHKFTIVMWDLITRDYSKWMTAKGVFQNVRKYARNGSIITFHDSLKSIDKLKTALPQCIEWLIQQGYAFKTLEEDMKWNRHLK